MDAYRPGIAFSDFANVHGDETTVDSKTSRRKRFASHEYVDEHVPNSHIVRRRRLA